MFFEDQHKSKEFTIANLNHKSKTNVNAPKEALSSKSGAISRVAFELDGPAKSSQILVDKMNPKSEGRSEVNFGIHSQEVVFP